MKLVSVVAVLISFFAFSLQNETDHKAFMERMRTISEQCIKESGVSADLVQKAFRDGNFADDQKLKCYFKCELQKMGHMNEAGNIDINSYTTHTPPGVDKETLKAAINKCNASKATDICEKAFQVSKCLREAYEPFRRHL